MAPLVMGIQYFSDLFLSVYDLYALIFFYGINMFSVDLALYQLKSLAVRKQGHLRKDLTGVNIDRYLGFYSHVDRVVISVSPIPRAIFAVEFEDVGATRRKSYFLDWSSPARKGMFGEDSILTLNVFSSSASRLYFDNT